ncbi:MAG: GNAT family N-acetyltransferase [Rickettsiales bacterium]|jgi:ribosomal protein S18 acetylase RimI-like enzyme|nr:GNAT family N-acetyltransferase [Rickettsiales bacterium]
MIKIRKIRKSDSGEFVRLAGEFTAFLGGLGDYSSVRFSEDAFLRFGFGRRKVFDGLIAMDDNGRACGYLLYSHGIEVQYRRMYATLDDLFVSESKRGGGIGKALMNKFVSICRKEYCTSIRLSVWNKNPVAMEFYEKYGYKDYSATGEKILVLEL